MQLLTVGMVWIYLLSSGLLSFGQTHEYFKVSYIKIEWSVNCG